MIIGISNNTSEPSFEQTYISGCITENDGHTNLIIVLADLTAPQQTIYNDFIGLTGDNAYFQIDNTECLLSFDRFTSSAITEGETSIDYNSADPGDKTKIDDFIQLLSDLTA